MNDVRRIAFVSERFLELQGLGPAIFGGVLIFATLMQHATGAASRHGESLQLVPFVIIMATQMASPLQRMYRRTFGDVVSTRAQQMAATIPLFVISGAALVDMIAGELRYSRTSVAGIALASRAAWVILRDWRWRLHYLVGLAAGVGAAAVMAATPRVVEWPGIDPVRGEACLLAYALIGLGLVVTGLLDHQLLTASLQPAPATQPGSEPALERRRGRNIITLGVAGAVPAALCLTLSNRALPLMLSGALLVSAMLAVMWIAVVRTRRALRDLRDGRRPQDEGPGARVDDEVIVACLVVALAATVDSALFSPWSPALTTTAIGGAGIWLAATDWRRRRYGICWAAAAVVVLPLIPLVPPARAFTVFVLVMASALICVGLRTPPMVSFHRSEHANTI